MRSAISRAYYAAFIQARNYLRDQDGLAIPTQNTHEYVINQFRNSADEERQKIGRQLRRLRQRRNQADYDDTFANLQAIAKTSLKLAAKIIAKLQSI